jgi:opacity protein-like surface antigen
MDMRFDHQSNDRNPIMTRLFIGATLAAFLMAPALAADMAVKAPPPAPIETYSPADIATTPRDVRFVPKNGLSGQVRMASRSEARKFLSRLMCHSRLMASLRVLQHSK